MNTPRPTVTAALFSLLWLLATSAFAEPSIKVAVLKYGTVNWELDTLSDQGFDRDQGFTLEVLPLAGMTATRTALKSGAAEMIVADWMWVTAQRDRGEALQFIPYSSSVGKLMLARDSTVTSLEELRGKRIGIAGGPTSKGWLLLRALGLRQGIDLKAETEQQYAAPPLLNAALAQGRLDAVITFWHYAARLEAEGLRPLFDLKSLGTQLGMGSELPMIGYVFRQAWAEANPDLVASLQAASERTKRYLAEEPAAWERLRPMMKAENEAVFEHLRAGYLEGTPGPLDEAQIDDAERMFSLLARVGGERLVGDSQRLDRDTFWQQP
jgi:NitT/TauT family transport system substrate-binding protein